MQFDQRWRLALHLRAEEATFDPSLLTVFLNRLVAGGDEGLAFEAVLDHLVDCGWVPKRSRQRLDSTHVRGPLSAMSRLECVRETIRLLLEEVEADSIVPESWAGHWELCVESKVDPRAKAPALEAKFAQAGRDALAILTEGVGRPDIAARDSFARLRRVFEQNYTVDDRGEAEKTRAQPPGAVRNPHEPEAQWSTKSTTKDKTWVGYKVQVAETVREEPRERGEPTANFLTTVVTQDAATSDKAGMAEVLAEQRRLRVLPDARAMRQPRPEPSHDRGRRTGSRLPHAPDPLSRTEQDATPELYDRRGLQPPATVPADLMAEESGPRRHRDGDDCGHARYRFGATWAVQPIVAAIGLAAFAAGCALPGRAPPARPAATLTWQPVTHITFGDATIGGASEFVADPGLTWSIPDGVGRISGVTQDEDWIANRFAVAVTNDTRALLELSVDFRAAASGPYLLVGLRGNRHHDGREAPLCLYFERYDRNGQYKPTTRWLHTSATPLEGDLFASAFGDEADAFHTLRIVLDRTMAQVAYYVDDRLVALLQLGAPIAPMVNLQIDVATPYQDQSVDVEWDNLRLRTAGPPLNAATARTPTRAPGPEPVRMAAPVQPAKRAPLAAKLRTANPQPLYKLKHGQEW